MARNIEIKARVRDMEELECRVAQLSDGEPTEIYQDDTFFNCENGRLKLRVFPDGTGQLIFYERVDEFGPKESFYLISRTKEPTVLGEILSKSYGTAGRVKKHRMLYMSGRTRIHVDRVEGLGEFLELEVVLRENEPAESGVGEAQLILSKLEVSESHLIQGAYVDLMQKSGT